MFGFRFWQALLDKRWARRQLLETVVLVVYGEVVGVVAHRLTAQ